MRCGWIFSCQIIRKRAISVLGKKHVLAKSMNTPRISFRTRANGSVWRRAASVCFLGHQAATLWGASGSVVAWGNNNALQTQVPAGLTATAVAGGGSHSLALKADHTVAAWGFNLFGQTNVPPG